MVDVPARSPRRPLLAAAAACGLLLTGCAQFDDSAADADWQAAPQLTPQRGPQPQLPEAPAEGGAIPGGGGEQPGPGGGDEPIPPPDGCKDHDPFVIGTCVDTVTAVAGLPLASQPSALAGEQRSGRIFKVVAEKKKTRWAKLSVNTAGGGGLTGLALSPSYPEDHLVFAYITTARDNRVVRLAKGQKPKPVLTGIPRGSTGNRGALATDRSGAILVATGDAGDPQAAANPKSLAGKLLRIDTSGKPAEGNPKSGSTVIASGLHTPGGVCAAFDGSRIWVTDRGPEADTVHLVERGKPLGSPVWRWKDQPGVAGCVDSPDGVTVGMSTAANIQFLDVDEQGSVTGKPLVAFNDKKSGYGRIGGLDMLSESVAVAGTVNRDGGDPISSDDRVFLFRRPEGGQLPH